MITLEDRKIDDAIGNIRGVLTEWAEENSTLEARVKELEDKNEKLSSEVDAAEGRAAHAEEQLEERDWSKMAAAFHDYARGRGWITDQAHDVPYHVTPTVYRTALESALDEAL